MMVGTQSNRVRNCCLLLVCFLSVLAGSARLLADEPLLQNLPAGLFVASSTEVPASQTRAIGDKLGGKITRLTNSVVRVHGRAIQVNVIIAADTDNAASIYASLTKIKSPSFLVLKDDVVVEYVGNGIDDALATKTTYELGLRAKPSQVTYQVLADIATVETADYGVCNRLFSEFIALDNRDGSAMGRIKELAERFTFGNKLSLRNAILSNPYSEYLFKPAATNDGFQASDPSVVFQFDRLPTKAGVPFVKVQMTITVSEDSFSAVPGLPPGDLVTANKFWPADNAVFKRLAAQITAGRETDALKAKAILEWLTPGKNIKYSGETGSRWGTEKVLAQKFGHCWDFSDCFITLARAANVPARQVAGWFYGSSGHVWAEYYDRESKGWVQVDPTGGSVLDCGIYHIPYFTSEDGEMPIVYVGMPSIKVVDE